MMCYVVTVLLGAYFCLAGYVGWCLYTAPEMPQDYDREW